MVNANYLRRTEVLVAITILLLCTFNLVKAAEGGLTVSQAVETAVANNPGLAQMRERHLALLEVPAQVASLPDPIVNVNAMNFRVPDFHRRQEAMTQVQFGVMQAFPFPGKLTFKKEAAEFEALAAGLNVEDLAGQLIADVRKTWWQIHFLDRALATVERNQQLFREFIQIATKKYETGIGLQQDVLLAQLELSRLLDQEIQVDAARRQRAIELNVLMDRPRLDEVRLAEIESKSLTILENKRFYFELAEARPLLKKMHAQAEAAKSRLGGAERDLYPDFTVGVNYGDRRGDNPNGTSRDDFFSVMVGVKIPLYAGRKQDKAVRQRERESESARYAALDTRGRIFGSISKILTSYQKAADQHDLYGTTIVPQASQTVQSMLAGYQVNEVDFLNLVRAQITLLNYELQYWRSLSDAKQSLAALEGAVGEANIYE